jgi:hypothetical protein
MNTLQRIALAVSATSLFVIAPAHSGGPLANCDDGVPFLWANGGRTSCGTPIWVTSEI